MACRPAKGSQKIHVGQIGIRCAYCVDNTTTTTTTTTATDDEAAAASLSSLLLREGSSSSSSSSIKKKQKSERAVCYPQSISRIYQTVADMQRRHFEKCDKIPVRVMGAYKSLKSTRPRGEGNPATYWESSAREIGLVDTEGVGIGVMMENEDMVEQFLLQRKNVEGNAVADGEKEVEHDLNASSMDTAQVEGGDYETKLSAKRHRSAKEEDKAGRSEKEEDQSSRPQSQLNGGQETIISAVNYTSMAQIPPPPPPPPASSFSDAHLLASMRDGASPSFRMNNGTDNSTDVHLQLNENDPIVQHGMMMENNIDAIQQIVGNNLGEELTQHLNGGLDPNQQHSGRSDTHLQEDSANIAPSNGTVLATENEFDIKVIEEV